MDEPERFAFWLNVYNLLIMHGSVAHASSLSSRLGALRVLRLHSRRFIFEVAGVSISAIEIEHALLRNGHPRPAFIGTSLFFPKFSANDPRLALAPRLAQPFVTFGLVAGTASSPPLRIYDSQGTIADLMENARQHLRRTASFQSQARALRPAHFSGTPTSLTTFDIFSRQPLRLCDRSPLALTTACRRPYGRRTEGWWSRCPSSSSGISMTLEAPTVTSWKLCYHFSQLQSAKRLVWRAARPQLEASGSVTQATRGRLSSSLALGEAVTRSASRVETCTDRTTVPLALRGRSLRSPAMQYTWSNANGRYYARSGVELH